MSSLGKALRETIRNLEKIRDLQKTPSDDVIAMLRKLYDEQINLVDAAIKRDTKEYVKATNAMNKAAQKTKDAIDDLAKLDEAIKKIADAMETVSLLLFVA